MRFTQKLVSANFALSNISGTALGCFSLDLLIKTLGADSLGTYFALAALVSISLILLSITLSAKFSALIRFIGIHVLLAVLATLCLISPSDVFQARVAFLGAMGFVMLTYFGNWSIGTLFVTPFESKRIFPWFNAAAQIGIFIGSLVAMAIVAGIGKGDYFLIWLTLELLMILNGLFLLMKGGRDKTQQKASRSKQEVHFLDLFKHYKLVPRLTIWVLLWGLLFTAIATMTGATFDVAGINLTMLYGSLSLVLATVTSLISTLVYPRAVRLLRLGAMLLLVSAIAALTAGSYFLSNAFTVAIIAYLVFNLLDGGFVVLALSTEFGLYPTTERDRIRLLGEILATSVGAACVGPLFALPASIVPWVLVALFGLLVVFGALSRRGYVREVIQFLKSEDPEERDNAVALFDMMENKEGYQQILDILLNGRDLPTQISVLSTFSSLATIKPAPEITELLRKTKSDPLKIAILGYFGSVSLKKLDPFLQHELFENLKAICEGKGSNNLRATAVKLWVQSGPIQETVGFITEQIHNQDERIVANAIEGLNYVQYPGTYQLIKPFLESSVPRIRANAIVALWRYPEGREPVVAALEGMLQSKDHGEIASGAWAAGEVQATQMIPLILEMADDPEPLLKRGIPIALLKLGNEEHVDKVIEIILGDNTEQAMNTCYLSLRLSEHILNEKIIAGIYRRGEKARKLARDRYARCGSPCREQLKLLAGAQEGPILT